MTDERRKQLNEERIQWIHPHIRAKVAAVLRDLEGHGQRPLIARSTFRTPTEQMILFRQHRSKVRWSFHNMTIGGKPSALAADIVDAERYWGAGRVFWLMLGSAATAHGMTWGGMWGLPRFARKRMRRVFAEHLWHGDAKVGWDPAHIQVRGMSLRQARRMSS